MRRDSRRLNRLLWSILLIPVLMTPRAALAHPMGNFSINHYAKITLGATSVDVLYLVDFAEIPTYQNVREFGLTPKNGDASLAPYLRKEADTLSSGLRLAVDGAPAILKCANRQGIFADGAGGLPTMKIGFLYHASLSSSKGPSSHTLTYEDLNYSGHAGWKEVVVVPEAGATISRSTAPATDRSQELTNYSTDLLNSPPQQTSASVEFVMSSTRPEDAEPAKPAPSESSALAKVSAKQHPRPPSVNLRAVTRTDANDLAWTNSVTAGSPTQKPPTAPLRSNMQVTPRSRFTELIPLQGRLSFWALLSAAFIALGLGALHALEPGHGKTIVAAYLVGSRGTARHAVLLGVVVTAAHTAGVYLLGLVTLYASRYIVPEQLYPWLGAIAGLTITGLGIFMFLRHLTGDGGEHSHVVGENHTHWFTSIFKKPYVGSAVPELNAQPSARVSLRQLFMLGITGGIIPCPAALVVLLSAFSLHRIGFGLFLITAFSIGLAGVLVAVGLTMVYAKRFLFRFDAAGPVQRYLPLLSSTFMALLGLGIAASAFGPSFGVSLSTIPKEKLLPFVTVILLGLFLGMRHSTDPDHVVAVSTIVSRQGSIRNATTIGALWGLGHTLTIFLVGSAIIIFGVVIPPRLGLAMEFSVALMLIMLGVLNLTGVLNWINERFSREARVFARKEKSKLDRRLGSLGVYQTLRPLFVGLVHGLAGSAAVALLVLSTIKSPFWATAYLLVFGLGTMGGMMMMTVAMSLPLVYTSKRHVRTSRVISATSGVVSVAFGLFLVYQIGIVDGLFSAAPHWIPS